MRRSLTTHQIAGGRVDGGKMGGGRVDSGGVRRLVEMQRRFRVLENEKRSYSVITAEILKKQRNEIENLEKEKDDLVLLSTSLHSKNNERKILKTHSSLKILGSRQESLRVEIEKERMKKKEMIERIWSEKKKNKKLIRIVSNAVKRNNSAGNDSIYDVKNLSKLEGQLQLANSRFAKVLDSNKEIRADIQNLRSERKRFDRLVTKMEGKRKLLQQETIDIIYASNMAHKQREEAQDKTNQLDDKSRRELKQFSSESKEMERILESGENLESFIETKFAKREDDEKMREWREKKESIILAKKRSFNNDTEATYDEALRQIEVITGKDDVDMIILKFTVTDDENFALFNFVNNQSELLDKMQGEVDELSGKIEKMKNCSTKTKSIKREMVVKEEGEWGEMVMEMEGVQSKHDRLSSTLKKLDEKISQIYKDIHPNNNEDINERVGRKDERNENIILHLSAIEDKTDRLMLSNLVSTGKMRDTTSSKPTQKIASKLQLPTLKLPTLVSDRSLMVSNSRRSANFKSAKKTNNNKIYNRKNNNKNNNENNNNTEIINNEDDADNNLIDFGDIKKGIWVDDDDDNDDDDEDAKVTDNHMIKGDNKNKNKDDYNFLEADRKIDVYDDEIVDNDYFQNGNMNDFNEDGGKNGDI